MSQYYAEFSPGCGCKVGLAQVTNPMNLPQDKLQQEIPQHFTLTLEKSGKLREV